MFTVEKALKELAQYNGASGSCWDAPGNLTKLNSVLQAIFERGDYEGTMEYGCIPCTDGCFYLPYFLETIRTAWMGKTPYPVFNQHYMAFDNVTRAQACSSRTTAHFQATGIRRPITKTPSLKRYFVSALSSHDGDDGVEIRFKAQIGNSRKDFRVKLDDNDYSQGESVSDLLEATKPITQGDVSVYAVDGADPFKKELLAIYPAEMENPSFAQYRIFGSCSTCCSLVVYAKKKFFDLKRYDELVPIRSMQALKFGYQAFTAQERDDDVGYVNKIQLMDSHLSQQDENLQLSEPASQANVVYNLALDALND